MQMRDLDLENATESGVLYLVPDENGDGKRVVRKPHPPPSSPPLDEDFDAYTLETREPVAEFGTIKGRPISWVPTSPPLDEDFDAWTYTNTAGPITGTGTVYEEDCRPDSEDERKEENGERAENYQGSELRRGGLLRRGNGQIGRSHSFTASASRASGSARHHNGDREVRNQSNDSAQHDHSYRRTSPQDHRQYRDRPKSRTGTSSTRIGTTRDVAVRSNLSLQRNNHHSHQTISRRGPAAHDYEVIDSRVLEEGPERTVTISTWREKVANETRRSEVEMSVYYLSADDYVEQDSRYEEREKAKTAGQNGLRHGKEKGKQRDLLNDGWLRSKPVYYGSSSISKAYTPWPSGTNLADITGISRTSLRTKATEKVPIRSTVRDVSLMDWPQREYVEPRTSTPVQRPKRDTVRLMQSPVPPNGPQINRTGRGSSESTISSMHVASNPALEAFLTSCKPPLLYLAPILVGLGIRSNEHLRAVGRLKEETRNKEVREEALKRGMTIMEWAILLDRLQQNG